MALEIFTRDELMLMMMTDSEEDFIFFAIERSMKVELLINQNTDDDYERRWRIQKHRKHFMSISQIINCFWDISGNIFVAFFLFPQSEKKCC